MNEETTMILIDTALASGSASALDPEERKLQELVLAVRDDAPTPEADFALRMNARVAAGFPPKRSGPRALIAPLFAKRPPLMAMGAVATLLIALVVTLSVTRDSNHTANIPAAADSNSGSVAAAPAQKAVAPSTTSAGGSTESSARAGSGLTTGDSSIAPSPPVPSSGFVGGRDRKVERSAALVLEAPKDKISDVGDQVISVTDRYRGIVQRSSVTTSGDSGSTGSFDLRIPVGNLQPALRDLSALADVASRTENSDDVTASFVSARTRLEELNAERRGLLRRLAKAQTDLEASATRARLRIVNAQIDGQTQALAAMRRRTNYAVVSVTLQAKQGDSGGGGGISKGARDLRNSLIDSANLALRVLGVALPIALLLAILWWGGGRFNRRRREAILD